MSQILMLTVSYYRDMLLTHRLLLAIRNIISDISVWSFSSKTAWPDHCACKSAAAKSFKCWYSSDYQTAPILIWWTMLLGDYARSCAPEAYTGCWWAEEAYGPHLDCPAMTCCRQCCWQAAQHMPACIEHLLWLLLCCDYFTRGAFFKSYQNLTGRVW